MTDELKPLTAERTTTGETIAGVPVVAWYWEESASPEVVPEGKIPRVAFHWSTPPENAEVTRLVAATEITALRARVKELEEGLAVAEHAFEYIRVALIDQLAEPGRLAFWKAVDSRKAVRTLLKGAAS